ncbi:MAG: response regulator [Octadecabacter sp.]|nr:response regulator [Octadecabacter sp.]
MRICVIDDETVSLNVISAVLKRTVDHVVESFSSATQALERCREAPFDMILIDYQMPDINGVECVKKLRVMQGYQVVPIIMLTADEDRALRLEAIKAGATDFLNKPFDPEELRVRVKNLLALRQAQLALLDRAEYLDFEVQRATLQLRAREEELIWRLSRAIEMRDDATGEHISRVAISSKLIAQHMGLNEEFCRTIYLASPLHDAGKIAINDAILHKPGKLTKNERKIIQTHTQVGSDILAHGESDLIKMAHEIALSHHEKWDGSGYGNGLSGQDIPLSARIVAIADVFDALCSARSYKPAWQFEDAFDEILRQSGHHFDPTCVAAFESARDQISKVYAGNRQSNNAA